MSHWFTPYGGYDWTPANGFNEYYGRMIADFKQKFLLGKSGTPGIFVPTNKNSWIEYRGIRGLDIYVAITRMDVTQHVRRSGYVSPVIRLQVQMARQIRNRKGGMLERFFNPTSGTSGEARFEKFFDYPFHIEFPEDPKDRPPLIKIDNSRFWLGPSHRYHQLRGNWLCIIAGYSDWVGGKDNLVTAVGAAFDWTVWYFKSFQW